MTGVVKGSTMGNCIRERCQVLSAISLCMVFLLNFVTLSTHLYVQLLLACMLGFHHHSVGCGVVLWRNCKKRHECCFSRMALIRVR